MKAYVDQDLCIGCGLCASIAPDVFQMNADGKAEAYAEVTEDQLADVHDAMDQCPVEAISIEE